ncbi:MULTISPECIES: DUF3841 domain-containing protein [Pasteurellaceae]|uniref:DUF3841 domain-containing protein n=1 Tax=Pasteurella atlantica TaxID=2827233 RepID=A0AAW8CNG3_9PAST|nr:DUF3841 domain-containing protein [Pasteurella atlantica]MBR0573524.1 DUF3841 domain-containing protein [Pasteurella atlantica]MDP8039525.1 DUF3841 domain-containing protein [Pasteurella atlantica]MDP8041616.1 DUF3841 domain-containing protein [Pasteurella atlantica]MDP8043753.1 DUF3841 domain-containing protein [Pasteurella atlantica]MDP8045750.1 DUF3841 domain-containing protein [Pasteurella atlantica]
MNGDFVTLWTLQPIEWYESLLKNKIIFAKPHLSELYMDNYPNFRNAYDWLMVQMEERINPKPLENIIPIWAWYHYENSNKKKPDLRHSGLLSKGTKAVRIEFKKAKDKVLFSDFELWHYVLNYWYISDTETDDNYFWSLLEKHQVNFVDKEKYPAEIRKKVEDSWQKIFDMDYYQEYSLKSFNEKSIQATFWSLYLSEIIKVEEFTAR